MFEELMASMAAVPGWSTDDAALETTRTRWETEFKERRIVSGFLKDKSLGSKRLVSMPDRISNTISVADGGGGGSVTHRPTVCENGIFEPLYKNVIFLPRQAQDKHRENSEKTTVFSGHQLLPRKAAALRV
eukprot:COSAG06_NODE_23118_length_702_cov_0.862355_1_plen_130_part_10